MKIKKKIKTQKRPTYPNFFGDVTGNTHIFFFWPNSKMTDKPVAACSKAAYLDVN